MRLYTGIIAGLFILAMLPRSSAGSDVLPDKSFLADLYLRYTSVASHEPDIRELLDAAVKRSGLQSSRDLIEQVKFCEDGASHLAGVKQSRETRTYFLARELDESGFSESDLKPHYLDRNKDLLPPDSKVDGFRWDIGSDLITLYQVSDKRQICIKPGVTSQDAVELLAHELVHYARIPDSDQVPDVLMFSDADDFASRIVVQPGEELEAYKVQFSLAIRSRGKGGVGAPPSVLQQFTDQGQFVGQEKDLSHFILDDLQYRQKRFKPEYEDALKSALDHDEQVLELEKRLLELRGKQEGELRAAVQDRYRILDFFLSKYREISESYKRLLKLATESKDRLTKDSQERSSRCEEIRKRIALLH